MSFVPKKRKAEGQKTRMDKEVKEQRVDTKPLQQQKGTRGKKLQITLAIHLSPVLSTYRIRRGFWTQTTDLWGQIILCWGWETIVGCSAEPLASIH